MSNNFKNFLREERRQKMTENNVMSVDELLYFIENEQVWDYYKFPAFYGDKYKSKNDMQQLQIS